MVEIEARRRGLRSLGGHPIAYEINTEGEIVKQGDAANEKLKKLYQSKGYMPRPEDEAYLSENFGSLAKTL